MSRSSLVLICLLLLQPLLRAASPPPTPTKTSEVLVVAGGPTEEQVKPKRFVETSGADSYLSYGSFSLMSRQPIDEPHEVVIWSRYAAGLSFFELTPLIGVFGDIHNVEDLRLTLLGPTPDKAKTTGSLDDQQRLQALVDKNDARESKSVRWQRQVALQEMTRFDIRDLNGLFARYWRQKEFARTTSTHLSASQLIQLFEIPDAGRDEAARWTSFVKFLNDKNLSTPILRTKILSGSETRLFGYIRWIVKEDVTKAGGEILVAANSLEPETITATLDIQYEPSFFTRALDLIPTTLITTLIGLVGTLGGATIGYKFFLYQQDRLRQMELEKKFADKKIELAKQIRMFFTDNYENLRNSEDEDVEKVRQIRMTLIDKDIYPILLTAEIAKLNAICDPKCAIGGTRIEALHQLLERNFAEFMV